MKYGINNYKEEENIKLESDILYSNNQTPMAPSSRTYYDFLGELDFIQNRMDTLTSKTNTISSVMSNSLKLQDMNKATYKSEDDYNQDRGTILNTLKEIDSTFQEVFANTDVNYSSILSTYKEEDDNCPTLEAKTVYRQESISDFFTTIWDYIKKFFKWLWDGIKNIFNSVLNLFRSNKKVLENIKKRLEDLEIEDGERSSAKQTDVLIFYTQVLGTRHLNNFVQDINIALEAATIGQGKFLELVKSALEHGCSYAVTGNKLDKLITIADEIISISSNYISTDASIVPKTRVFHNLNTNCVIVNKIKDPGNYYCVGYDKGKGSVLLWCRDGIRASLVNVPVVNRDTRFAQLSPELAKRELIELCDLGIAICDGFDKKNKKEIEDTVADRETDIKNLITSITEIYPRYTDRLNEEDRNKANKAINDVVLRCTKIVNDTSSTLLNVISLVGKQPTYILKAIKDGIDTL